MDAILEAIVAMLDAVARFENMNDKSIEGTRTVIYAIACRAAAAEIRGALIRAARV